MAGIRLPDLRRNFLNAVALFQTGMAAVTLALGWLVGVDPLAQLFLTLEGCVYGLLATLPLLGFFAISYRQKAGPFRKIRELLITSLGPFLAMSRLGDLMIIAIFVGLTEELLFRGLLQGGLMSLGVPIALLLSNLIFGLAHAVTRMYAIIAGGIGIYLGLWFAYGPGENLLVPIIAHTLYDFVAFIVIRHDYLSRPQESAEGHEISSADSEIA